MALKMSVTEIGKIAPDFRLAATDGNIYGLTDVSGLHGTVVVFLCNHCPYVRAIVDRLVADAKTLAGEGIGFAAISSNDVETFPQDSFDQMKIFAKDHGFSFPYLYDESQEIAAAYGAVCTPDYFGINVDGTIEYRGRLDEGRTAPPPAGAKRELVDAMRMIAATGKGPAEQVPSVGCSLKWKDR